mmetsp:Transcript_8401/g.13336  ORF Transcript_8401/g.13336 Transcript_8401/m.13336 type:complete len:272 (-) Transcript_8401:748-1563(-)
MRAWPARAARWRGACPALLVVLALALASRRDLTASVSLSRTAACRAVLPSSSWASKPSILRLRDRPTAVILSRGSDRIPFLPFLLSSSPTSSSSSSSAKRIMACKAEPGRTAPAVCGRTPASSCWRRAGLRPTPGAVRGRSNVRAPYSESTIWGRRALGGPSRALGNSATTSEKTLSIMSTTVTPISISRSSLACSVPTLLPLSERGVPPLCTCTDESSDILSDRADRTTSAACPPPLPSLSAIRPSSCKRSYAVVACPPTTLSSCCTASC